MSGDEFAEFLTWLHQFDGLDHRLGDLCEDVERQMRILAHRGTEYACLDDVRNDVRAIGCLEARQTLNAAIRLFRRQRLPRAV